MNNVVKNESIIATKAYSFALGIITLYKYLVNEKKEYVLSKQLLRSGTSIGANINEALSAQSKRDFVHKLSISLKEARESEYWLNLFKASDIINEKSFKSLQQDCKELIKLLIAIIKTAKSNSK